MFDAAAVVLDFQPRYEQHLAHALVRAAGMRRQVCDPGFVPVVRQDAVEIEQHLVDPRLHPAATTLKASRAAEIVASMTSGVCALDMKPASNADGARYTPRSSIAWKKRLNAAVSQATAWA